MGLHFPKLSGLESRKLVQIHVQLPKTLHFHHLCNLPVQVTHQILGERNQLLPEELIDKPRQWILPKEIF